MSLSSSTFAKKTQALPAAVEGLTSLWTESLGNNDITVAVLDGLVDTSHPCFKGAQLTEVPTLASTTSAKGFAMQHGTHVTSIIFGQHSSPVLGIAPNCRGLIVPIFKDGAGGTLAPCSQVDLARAITQAVDAGADVINISGGQLTASGEPDGLLANAIRYCEENKVLIVAAAGNEGCDCLYIPAAIPSVLAVGGMDAQGQPFGNWGENYQTEGILAPGEHILGAVSGEGTALKTGTSFATPIVSGVVGLLLSMQLQQGRQPNPYEVRDALLKSALPCPDDGLDCRRFLAGSLNVIGAEAILFNNKGAYKVSDENSVETVIEPSETVVSGATTEVVVDSVPPPVAVNTIMPVNTDMLNAGLAVSAIQASECESCAAAAKEQPKRPNFVYAIGTVSYDFLSQARRDSIVQDAAGVFGAAWNPNNPQDVLKHFEEHPWEADAIMWTLHQEETPIYAIKPMGSYAAKGNELLREFVSQQLEAKVERVSIAGINAGTVTLQSGQQVPVIVPAIRGMFSWTTESLITAILGALTGDAEYEDKKAGLQNFLDRIYYELRNLGVTPQERAMNYAATNAFQIARVFEMAAGEEMELDSIGVERSPLCRPDSDCWDVKLVFFNPQNRTERAKKAYRFTVDVSDVVPVTVGTVRSWSLY